jgi:hypothetical protein
MAKAKEVTTTPEPAQSLYYEIETAGGDVYINIYGRNKRINIMSGQPVNPVKPKP